MNVREEARTLRNYAEQQEAEAKALQKLIQRKLDEASRARAAARAMDPRGRKRTE